VISRVICSLARDVPLSSVEKPEFFKLVFLDIGLLQHALGFDWQRLDPNYDVSTVCNGRFAEQYVGQELLAESSTSRPQRLHYWDRSVPGSDAEVDYLIEYENKITPLEVKSGLQGSLKSLHGYIKEYKPSKAFVLSERNIETLDSIHWLPLYLAGRTVGDKR